MAPLVVLLLCHEWDDQLLNDPRVTHLWDEDKVSGGFFGETFEDRQNWIQWDAYYLFDPGVPWNGASEKVLGSGRTIIGHSDELQAEIAPFLG